MEQNSAVALSMPPEVHGASDMASITRKAIMKPSFISAIRERRKIRLWFFSHKYNRVIRRVCIPLDIGKSQWGDIRYHVWDVENSHTISVLPSNVERVTILKDRFRPLSDLPKWDVTYTVKRKW